ncbi:hypothetical protein [Winogradskyella endarachnes]|nr:hypothetical protein [Winogradskyella endarachnes]
MKRGSDRPEKTQKDKEFIVKELGFNSEQIEKFELISEAHHHKMMRLSDDVRQLKDELFGGISAETVNEKAIDSISLLICEKETAKEKEIFYHFRKIQDIAKGEQKEKFKSILMDALRQGDDGNRPPPRGEDGHVPPSRMEEGRRPPPREN